VMSHNLKIGLFWQSTSRNKAIKPDKKKGNWDYVFLQWAFQRILLPIAIWLYIKVISKVTLSSTPYLLCLHPLFPLSVISEK
jgi:hypothetical protein